jgi:hypothetical protein
VTNNQAFIAAGQGGLIVIDVSSPTNCARVGACDTSGVAYSALYPQGLITLFGDNGAILQSDFFGPPKLNFHAIRPGQPLEFSVDAEIGHTFHLQSSEDLLNWQTISEYYTTNSTTIFLDPGASVSHRFFRVISSQQ